VQVLNVAGHQRLARSASAVSICTFVPVKQVYWDLQVYQRRGPRAPQVAVDLYVFCTSETSSKLSSKLSTWHACGRSARAGQRCSTHRCQYLYFCTSEASTFVPVKQVNCGRSARAAQRCSTHSSSAGVSICTFVPVKPALLYQ
jgi:hypothetical protein